jgi:hypothetical protein
VRYGGAIRWGFLVQFALLSACGFALLAALVTYAWKNLSAETVLLALWVLGTFCFAVFVNWNVAARSILPIAPAGAILAAMMWTRRAEASRESDAGLHAAWRPWVALAPALVVALLVCAADASLARTGRDAANQISDALGEPSGKVFFSGHWGFQQYMQYRGAAAFDRDRTELDVGDVVVIPDNNTGLIGLPAGAARVAGTLELRPMPLVSTMRPHTDAGFYSDVWGPLPFAFSRNVPAETYRVHVVEVPLKRR